jgi:hypothetical protein
MLILKIIIPIITYALIIYLCFRLYKRYYDRISSYIDETTDNWYDLPNWINWVLLILLVIGCNIAQIQKIYFYSIIIWFLLLYIMPFFYIHSKNNKIYNFFSLITLYITITFGIILFFKVDNSRDIIGKTFIKDYSVYYTEEKIRYSVGREDVESEADIAHINTNNENLDFFLNEIFPFLYHFLIVIFLNYSIILNISFKGKYKKINENE